MKRKIFIGLLIGLLLMTILPSCNETTKSLVECGEDVISLMAEMVDDEAYGSLYNLPSAYDKTIYKFIVRRPHQQHQKWWILQIEKHIRPLNKKEATPASST